MSGSSHVLDADAGPYPCGGGSGQLLCAAHQSNSVGTCHHFGGPWTYEAFAVKEAIGHYLQDSKGCVVRCAGEEEALRNLWEETRRNLLSIPPYPGRGFLKFTKRVSVPNLNDFEAMMRPRYPVEENCSGSCVDCVEDTGTRKCSCNFARVKCQVRTKGEQEENNIELVAYNEDPRFLFGKLSPFSKKKDVYQVVGCDYECRKGSPDVAVPANVRFLETEPAGDGSPLKLRLSRRELSRLQLPLAQCEGYDTDDWHPLEEIGRYPCWGGSGVMMCKKGSLRCHLGKKIFGGCNKLQPVSCHRFGPVWMDVFAVQDAVKRHADKFDDCVVRCDGTRTMANDLWEEAKDGLRTDPQYERPPANLRVGFEDWLREHYFADPSCSSSCGFQHNGPAVIPTLLYRHSCSNIPDCLCRVAHVKCQIVLSKSKHHQQVESWGFNARTQDVLKMLSLADANAKSEHPQTNDIHTKSCRSDCYGVM
ncbi:hypothetical protein GNI_104330 [Gregarina niphandrodes]|uniref:Uncharacterized protein n=1 Tax=Gregarina niphandrodes TaxID=110365 RepID=A0A023B482_GRENI|nr:hypothetical protein GNI_104330 [Gregarina niphandrodes]EZG56367.1 hypothetical protein GNI_104330 [Gregarina niphandrodes]|eukprot:XP_011131296.1 hypothetical protein GNI_104330 [Gregarina niphandrodes]